MSERPSDGMELDDLRDEFDWMFEFQSRMAERISGDADVHNLVDYVGKLESENAKLRELVRDMAECMDNSQPQCKKCKFRELNCQWFEFTDRMRELGIGVDA